MTVQLLTHPIHMIVSEILAYTVSFKHVFQTGSSQKNVIIIIKRVKIELIRVWIDEKLFLKLNGPQILETK